MPIVNAEAAHRANPRTYSIPRRAVREALRPGNLVKLPFVVDPPVGTYDVERMWVQVEEVADGRYRGRLDNEPRFIPQLRPGDSVAFGPEHVMARHAAPEDPLHTDPTLFAVVSRKVWEADEWPSRVERRDIPDPAFSGWFVFAGTEPSLYLADPANFIPIDAGQLFDRFRVLDSALEGPVGTVWVWNEHDLEYQAPRPMPNAAR